MYIRSLLIFCLFTLFSAGVVHAQKSDFCEAVTAIMRDAPNQFRNVRGRMIEKNATATMYQANIIVPGTINSRVVSSMGLFYEGALYQSKTKDGLMHVYEKCRDILNDCLGPQGYKLSSVDNFSKEVGEFKKVVYMKPIGKDTDIKNMPGHIALEMDYNKANGLYTLSFYIFEH